MYNTKLIIIFYCFLLPIGLIAQNNFSVLAEPAFTLNYDATQKYRTNFSVRTRAFLYDDNTLLYKTRQIDLSHFSTLVLNSTQNISLGILYRFRENFEENDNELRLSQQFNITNNNEALRFGHRILIEQRIFPRFVTLRSRYRLALDFPLNGATLDVKEWYLVTSVEGLLSINNQSKPILDQRSNIFLGRLFSKKLRVQVGTEYRLEALNIHTRQRLFLLSNVIYKL